jgi:cytochrome c-type biogenesis protein CcmE
MKQAPTDGYRVNGTVVPGSIQRRGLETSFLVTDGSTEIPVETRAPLPDTFKSRAEVVARGTFAGGSFSADEVLAKCPSKFKAREA